jgi:membrane fusion protein, copper/silver efflux system
MKKIFNNRTLQFSLVLIAGLLLGWLIFKTDRTTEHDHEQIDGEETTYTCSMHPQIRQNEPGKCPLCGMDLIPVAQNQGSGDSNPSAYSMSAEAIALANVQTQRVETVIPEREVILTGKVAVNEQRIAMITANYSGRIEQLFIDFTGQPVQKGQKLATIYSPELVTAQTELTEAARFKEINPGLYQAAREKLRLWKITEAQINEIENSGVVLTEFEVYADQSGVVIRRDVTRGDYVTRGSVLFEIADLSQVWVFLDAYESDLPFLRNGQKITFSVASVPGREFNSSISFIDPFINPLTRTASVRAEVNNQQQILKPDMFVNGKVKAVLPVKEKALVIPNTALLWTGKRSVVYVKLPQSEIPTFELREITIGSSLGDYYLVESGLSEGEEIVVNGAFSVDAAAQLAGKFSMMMRPESKTMEVPLTFREQITAVAKAYFEVKNALVNDKAETAQKAAGKVTGTLAKVDMGLLEGDAHLHWMALQKQLQEAAKMISETVDIENQREHFNMLSEAILETTESFGLEIDKTYRLFCPMAFDDKGAYWLSESDEILNPYFGDMMLRCGEVKQTYRKGQRIFQTATNQNTQAAEHNH